MALLLFPECVGRHRFKAAVPGNVGLQRVNHKVPFAVQIEAVRAVSRHSKNDKGNVMALNSHLQRSQPSSTGGDIVACEPDTISAY